MLSLSAVHDIGRDFGSGSGVGSGVGHRHRTVEKIR